MGAVAILDWLQSHAKPAAKTDWLASAATGLVLAVPLYYGNGLLFGLHSEIKPSRYPAGWYQVDSVLAADPHPDRALFLPWHEYMSLSFVRNQNNVVVSPAPSFFSIPVLVSANPEVEGIAPPSDPDQLAITSLVTAGDRGLWAQNLMDRNVKYVLLARELDWTYFKFLDDQPGLTKVGDFGSIILYRVDAS